MHEQNPWHCKLCNAARDWRCLAVAVQSAAPSSTPPQTRQACRHTHCDDPATNTYSRSSAAGPHYSVRERSHAAIGAAQSGTRSDLGRVHHSMSAVRPYRPKLRVWQCEPMTGLRVLGINRELCFGAYAERRGGDKVGGYEDASGGRLRSGAACERCIRQPRLNSVGCIVRRCNISIHP